MTEAPQSPTTSQLEAMHPLSEDAILAIARQRHRISEHLIGNGVVAGAGGCSSLESIERSLITEGSTMARLQETSALLSTFQRLCVWKPRTNPDDWHGEETTNPVGAHGLITRQANRYAQASMEVAHPYHMNRYADRLVFAWTGARNIKQAELIVALALADPMLPLGIKNGLDGDIKVALEMVDLVNSKREVLTEDPAPAILIWRGGESAPTRQAWRSQRQEIFDLTDGRFIDDSAHGTSMAHDPNNMKSDYGQQAALEHVVELSRDGYISAGLLIESSDVKSITDPNLPFKLGCAAVRELVSIKNSQLLYRNKSPYFVPRVGL